jgi:peptide/nickel transport system substrate-binding protein
MRKNLFLIISMLTLVSMALAACAAPQPTPPPTQPPGPAAATQLPVPTTAPTQPPAPPAKEKTLVVAIGADATYLDPESVMNNESGFVMATVFDGLTKYKKGTSEPGPGLAEKWDVSSDGKVYTFYLRKGVKFHDGTPWNADAAIAEIDRVMNKNNPYYIFNQAGIHSFAESTWGLVKTYEKVDDNTIKVTLSEPFSPFLTSLSMAWSGMVSPASVKQYGFKVSDHPVGTGPFKFVEWVRDDHITLEANKDYWGGKPKVDKLIFRVVPEASVRLLKLEQGEVHIVADVSPDDYPRIQNNKDLKLVTQPGLTVNGFVLVVDAPPFNDVRVRQAFNYAVNKDEMNKFLYKDAAITAATLIPPILMGYPKDIQPYPYDPAKAKQLLADAGYPNGFTANALCYENPRGYNPVGIKMAVAIQEYMAKVNVKLNLQTLEWGAFLDKRRSKDNHDIGMAGWSGDNGDSDNFFYELLSTATIPVGNTAHYSNPKLDDILKKARTTTDIEERRKLYEQASYIVHDDAPWLFVNHTIQVRATRANVDGFALNPLQMFWYMEDVDLK